VSVETGQRFVEEGWRPAPRTRPGAHGSPACGRGRNGERTEPRQGRPRPASFKRQNCGRGARPSTRPGTFVAVRGSRGRKGWHGLAFTGQAAQGRRPARSRSARRAQLITLRDGVPRLPRSGSEGLCQSGRVAPLRFKIVEAWWVRRCNDHVSRNLTRTDTASMPELDGLQATRRILAANDLARILITPRRLTWTNTSGGSRRFAMIQP
jgi:hypothetical protein